MRSFLLPAKFLMSTFRFRLQRTRVRCQTHALSVRTVSEGVGGSQWLTADFGPERDPWRATQDDHQGDLARGSHRCTVREIEE
jgi:hypothetical protein